MFNRMSVDTSQLTSPAGWNNVWKNPDYSGESSVSGRESGENSPHSPVKRDISYFIDKVPVHKKKWKWSIVRIETVPIRKAIEVVYPNLETQLPSLCSKKPINEWSKQKCEKVSKKLIDSQIPLKKIWLDQVLSLLQLHQKELMQSSHHKYPATFQVQAYYKRPDKIRKINISTKKIHFELEIHSAQKAFVFFFKNKKTVIRSGLNKVVYKIFSLGSPEEEVAYSYAHSQKLTSTSFRAAAENEERFLTILQQNSPHIVKVYDIFYYSIIVAGRLCKQQVITMPYYPINGLDLLDQLKEFPNEKILSDQKKYHITRQLLSGTIEIHKEKIVHRDLKPENFLLTLDHSLVILDFGLSCTIDELKKLTNAVGTLPYAAPEALLGKAQNSEFAQDVWSMGCILWLLLFQCSYPWHFEVSSREKFQKTKALNLMYEFSKCLTPDKNSSIYPLWRMLSFKHQNRCSLYEALDYYQNKVDELQKREPTYHLKEKMRKDMLALLPQARQKKLHIQKKFTLYQKPFIF
jgi:serine/threonine protein kinase